MLIDDDTKHPGSVDFNPLPTADVTYASNTDVPPPYAEPFSSSSSIPPLPLHNHLRIERADGNIKGTYVIDPSLPAPQGTGTVKQLTAHTKDGYVDLKVYFVGSRHLTEKTRVIVGSDRGDVKLAVVERPPHIRLWVTAISVNGNVSMSLPPGFNGLLTIVHKNGTVNLRPSLAAVTRTFEETATGYIGWIGEWNGENVVDWQGDECRISIKRSGDVKVGFYEGDVDGRGVTGLFKQLFK